MFTLQMYFVTKGVTDLYYIQCKGIGFIYDVLSYFQSKLLALLSSTLFIAKKTGQSVCQPLNNIDCLFEKQILDEKIILMTKINMDFHLFFYIILWEKNKKVE